LGLISRTWDRTEALRNDLFLVAEALKTAYHDVQYQGWIMHYQRRRFRLGRVVAVWIGLALLYGLAVGILEIVGLTHAGWAYLFTPFTMLVLFHYYIDGKIWKLRDYPELRALLTNPQQERHPSPGGAQRS
jgi:hypothetical protein